MREELLAAIGARVQRIIDTRDLAPARDPQAHTEAVRLAELLQASSGNADDLRAWYGLGWLQFYRFLAKADADNEATFTVAIEAFAHCFLAGVVEGLPETALPMIAEAAHHTRPRCPTGQTPRPIRPSSQPLWTCGSAS